eukprot:5584415-Amphidinium_carterae.1
MSHEDVYDPPLLCPSPNRTIVSIHELFTALTPTEATDGRSKMDMLHVRQDDAPAALALHCPDGGCQPEVHFAHLATCTHAFCGRVTSFDA